MLFHCRTTLKATVLVVRILSVDRQRLISPMTSILPSLDVPQTEWQSSSMHASPTRPAKRIDKGKFLLLLTFILVRSSKVERGRTTPTPVLRIEAGTNLNQQCVSSGALCNTYPLQEPSKVLEIIFRLIYFSTRHNRSSTYDNGREIYLLMDCLDAPSAWVQFGSFSNYSLWMWACGSPQFT